MTRQFPKFLTYWQSLTLCTQKLNFETFSFLCASKCNLIEVAGLKVIPSRSAVKNTFSPEKYFRRDEKHSFETCNGWHSWEYTQPLE